MNVSARHYGEMTDAGLLKIQVTPCSLTFPGHAGLKEPKGVNTLQYLFLPWNSFAVLYSIHWQLHGRKVR